MRYSSRVSACRRELNSLEAASPQSRPPVQPSLHPGSNAPPKRREAQVHTPVGLFIQPLLHGPFYMGTRLQVLPAASQAHPLSTLLRSRSVSRFGARGEVGGAKTRLLRLATVPPSTSGALHEATVVSASRSHGSARAPLPNHSFKPTRYGRQRKAGLRYSVHFLRPALRCLPPRAA